MRNLTAIEVEEVAGGNLLSIGGVALAAAAGALIGGISEGKEEDSCTKSVAASATLGALSGALGGGAGMAMAAGSVVATGALTAGHIGTGVAASATRSMCTPSDG